MRKSPKIKIRTCQSTFKECVNIAKYIDIYFYKC